MSEQFRNHGLNLAAAAAAVAASGGVPPPHGGFPSPAERPAPVVNVPPRDRSTPNNLNLEPQLDFYSQRLRQLAGTTSPGAAQQASSPLPRKHSPQFASPSPSLGAQIMSAASVNNINGTNNNNNNISTISTNNNNSGVEENNRASSTSPKLEENQGITSTPRSSSTPLDVNKPNSPVGSGSGDEVHSCDYCGKKFRYRNNLEVHRRTHTGELPYKCKVCDHACAQSSKLKRHMKLHKTPEDRTSNAGSVETLDGEDSEEEEDLDEEEDEDEDMDAEEEEAEDLSVTNSTTSKNVLPPASLVGELMDKFGLSNIAQYSEAYKQALQESGSALKLQMASKDRDNNNSTLSSPIKLGEEFAKGLLPGPPPQPLPLFPPFNDTYEASKRIKLELERGDWWLPGLPRESKGVPGPSALIPGPLMKKETSRRNDTCEFCGKVFKNCSNLTVHRRSHTGEKPYKCELCSYACAQSSKLTRHMKTHGRIGKDVYRCRFCEMPFSVPSTLEKHMRKCVVNQGKGHLLPSMPSMLSGDEDSSTSVASKEAT